LKRKRVGIVSGPVEVLLSKVDIEERIFFGPGENLQFDGRSKGRL